MTHNLSKRMCQYFLERFNPASMGLIAVMLGVSSSLFVAVTQQVSPSISLFILPPIALFFFLLRLRLFDEFKDAEHDKKFHPERPVPRGLVTLNELFIVLCVCSVAELAIAVYTDAIFFFLVAAAYSLLMFKEFFISDWLREHFTFYIISHEVLLIPILLYLYSIVGVETQLLRSWDGAAAVAASISVLFMLEVARKFRAPTDETAGNDTYTSQYGHVGASVLLLIVIFVNIVSSAWLLNERMYVFPLVLIGVCLVYLLNAFVKKPDSSHSKKVFLCTSVYSFISQLILIMYWILQLYGNYLR